MKYLKLSIKFLVLIPIAFTVDVVTTALKGIAVFLELTEKYSSRLFDKALAWCNDVN